MNLSIRRCLPWRRIFTALALLLVSVPGPTYAATFVWEDATGISDDDSVDGLTLNADTGPVTMAVSVDVTDGGDITSRDTYSNTNEGPASYENDGTFGGLSNFVEVGFDLSDCQPDNVFDLNLTFSAAVTNLQFTVADVDQSSWDDNLSFFVDIEADGLGVVNLKTLMDNTATGAPFLTLSGDIQESASNGGIGYEGQASVPSSSTAGNIIFDSTGEPEGFKSVTIRYTSDTCTGNPGSQRIGLGDITFNGTTVPVTLSWFNSERVGEQASLEWETAQEVGHAGFQVYTRDKDGWELADEQLIIREGPGDSLEPTSYSHTVTLADEAIEWLALADVSVNEVVEVHGPFRVGEEYGARVEQAAEFDWSTADLPKMSLDEKRSAISERVQNVLQSQSDDGGR